MKFSGYHRPDGKVGIRNHVLILPTCACASESCRIVASQVKGSVNVVINTGCSDVAGNTEMTQRILRGFACNGNVYGIIIIGLGCETVGHQQLKEEIRKLTDKPVESLGIQEIGGTVDTIAAAVKAARTMVARASQLQKEECDISELLMGIECGGSDATSGIISNPAVGKLSDRVIELGGSTMMSETIEFIGGEHILARRGATDEIHNEIISICKAYEEHLKLAGQNCREGQPTPGNKAGGLSTLEEKSLGCIRKGGTKPVVEVLQEGMRPTQKGAIIMDTPGYDIASVTSMVAGGCQVIVFTTGRGTPTGNALVPVIKVCGNPQTCEKMKDNIDEDLSTVVTKGKTIEQAADQLFEGLMDVCNGKMTKAEIFGFSDIAVDHICRFI